MEIHLRRQVQRGDATRPFRQAAGTRGRWIYLAASVEVQFHSFRIATDQQFERAQHTQAKFGAFGCLGRPPYPVDQGDKESF